MALQGRQDCISRRQSYIGLIFITKIKKAGNNSVAGLFSFDTMTTYDSYVITVLLKMGDKGISLRNLVRSVYNLCTTFFFTPDYDDVYRKVQQYVLRNSASQSSLIERMSTRGYYRLNKNSVVAEQLILQFNADNNEDF